MTREEQKALQYRLLSEKVVNESCAEVGKYTSEIEKALEKKDIGEKELLLLKIAARAFVQRVKIERITNMELFGIDLQSVPCGKDHSSCDDCSLEVCDYF